MIARCEDPKNRSYANYGGRGIKLCARWRRSFKMFMADMGPRPSSEHSIDRINVNGHYEPGNCRWVTDKEQRRNLRRTVFVEIDGRREKLVELTERLGLNGQRVYERLKLGWSLEDALTVPLRKYRNYRKEATCC